MKEIAWDVVDVVRVWYRRVFSVLVQACKKVVVVSRKPSFHMLVPKREARPAPKAAIEDLPTPHELHGFPKCDFECAHPRAR